MMSSPIEPFIRIRLCDMESWRQIAVAGSYGFQQTGLIFYSKFVMNSVFFLLQILWWWIGFNCV